MAGGLALTLTLVTTKLPYTFNIEGTVLEYHQIARRLFWGYRSDGHANVAWPEKALLDLIYIRHLKTRATDARGIASLLDDMYLEEIDAARLRSFIRRFGEPYSRQLAALLKPRIAEPAE
ncbi:MAG: hypothetical protein AB1374_09385 [Bacillota bacterium]